MISSKTISKLMTSIGHYPENARNIIYNAFISFLDNTDKIFKSKILMLFNKYNKDPLSFSDISLKLGRNRMYLTTFSAGGISHESYSKYFDLLLNVYLLESSDLNLEKTTQLKELKEE